MFFDDIRRTPRRPSHDDARRTHAPTRDKISTVVLLFSLLIFCGNIDIAGISTTSTLCIDDLSKTRLWLGSSGKTIQLAGGGGVGRRITSEEGRE